MTLTLEQPDVSAARRAIESLRAGVPSRAAVSWLGTTQLAVEQSFDQSLRAVEEGKGIPPIVVAANFGAGKTHLLEYLQARAERQGMVTAYVVVSPEMPLGNPQVVLKSIHEAAQAPGRVGRALRAVASDLNANTTAFHELEAWARDSGIDERFAALLLLYRELWTDEDLRQQILEDFEGKQIGKTQIKQRLKDVGHANAFALGSTRAGLLAHDRLRLLARLFRAAGTRGLVIFFDELERLARFSYKQRVAAYQEIGWWTEIAARAGGAIVPVFAMTAAFMQETVTGGSHNDAAKLNLAALQRSEEEADHLIARGIDVLKGHRELSVLTGEQERDIQERIRKLYERAYDTSLAEVAVRSTDDLMPIRSKIRRWITEWDLRRYDPQYQPTLQEDEMHFDAAEMADADVAGQDDE